MLDKPAVNTFSHVKPGDTPWVGEGLRDFFLYRDLGVATATGGRVLAQACEGQQSARGRHRLAPACRRLPHRDHAEGLGAIYVRG